MTTCRAVVIALVGLLGCDGNSSKQPKVETEKTLKGEDLEKRKAYTADAEISAVGIATDAAEFDLCASLGDGEIGPTPPIKVDCNASDSGQCVPVDAPTKPWEYSAAIWQEGVWKKIDFSRKSPHRYHYALEWRTKENGECETVGRAFGDLDDDGIYSTFETVNKLPGPDEWNNEMSNVVNRLE